MDPEMLEIEGSEREAQESMKGKSAIVKMGGSLQTVVVLDEKRSRLLVGWAVDVGNMRKAHAAQINRSKVVKWLEPEFDIVHKGGNVSWIPKKKEAANATAETPSE